MKKPLEILISDIHLNKDNTESVIDCFKQVIDVSVNLKVNRIIILGDIFTNRIGQNLSILLAFDDLLRLAEENDVEIFAIPGNHDKTDLESEKSYLDIFRNHKNLFVFDKETVIKNGDFNYCFLPYFKEDTEFLKRLISLSKNFKENEKNILFTHIAVDGVSNNSGRRMENDLKYKLFKSFIKVFVGHFHDRTQVGKNIFYIGSLKPNNFGENNDKGYTILYSDCSHEFFTLNFKKYIKLEFDLDDNITKEQILKRIYDLHSDDNIRCLFAGSSDKIISFETFFIELKNKGIDVKKENKMIKQNFQTTSENTITFDFKKIKQNFYKFCLENKIKKEKMILGLKYLELIKNS